MRPEIAPDTRVDVWQHFDRATGKVGWVDVWGVLIWLRRIDLAAPMAADLDAAKAILPDEFKWCWHNDVS